MPATNWDDVSSPVAQSTGDWDAVSSPANQPTMVPTQSPTPQQADQSSIGSRFEQGLKDPVDGLAQLMLHSLPDTGVLKGSAQFLDNDLAGQEQQYQAARAATGNTGVDWARMGGNLVTTAPVMAAMPGGGTSLVGRAVGGAASGATLNSLNPVTSGDDYWSSKGAQAGTGAVVGGVLSPITELAARAISPNVSPEVQGLIDQGVNPTPGQILGGFYKNTESKATSVPVLGDMIKSGQANAVEDFNRAAYNRVLAPIGQSADSGFPVGNEGVAKLQTAVSDAYDNLLPQLNWTPTPDVAQQIGQLRSTMRPAVQQQFDDVFKNSILNRLDNNGQLTGQALKDAESELGANAKNFATSGDATDREVGNKLRDALGAFRQSLVDQNPNGAGQKLQSINQAYANLKIINKAANKDIGGGVFSPGQLQQAVRTVGGETKFSAGNAPMQDLSQPAYNVLGGGYPDSGTAGRNMLGYLAGGVYTGHPVAAGVGALAALPYTKLGQKVITPMLTSRPAWAQPVANAMRALPAPVGGNTANSLLASWY